MTKTRRLVNAAWFIPGGELLGIRSDLKDTLKALDGKTPHEIRAFEDWSEPASDPADPCDDPNLKDLSGCALVQCIGPITRYAGVCDWMFGGCSVQQMMADFEAAFADPNTTSILLEIDSPGGQIAGIADFAARIKECSATKPVIAMITGSGCSAAYWLASACTKIIASETALLGSIGCCVTVIDTKKADEKAGIREIDFVSSQSPKKNQDPTTKEGAAAIQNVVDSLAAIFVHTCAVNRGVSTEKVLSDFGQGDVVLAADAVTRGMADKVGTMADAVALALELAGESGTSTATNDRRAIAAGRRNVMPPEGENTITTEAAETLKKEAAAGAATKERERISAILKLNTTANRAVAGEYIDAAIADPNITSGMVAERILEAQNKALDKVKGERDEDANEMPPVETPKTPVEGEDTDTKAGSQMAALFNKSKGVK